MKRVVSLLCIVCMLFTLCACGGQPIVTEDNVTVNTEGLTDLQKAVVITAESYSLRGFRAQYDQKSLTKGTSRSVGRRSTMTYKPEDFTAQSLGYHDCSSFVFDVYWNALGMDISEGPTKRNTKWYMENPHVIYRQNPEDEKFTSLSKEEKQAKLDELREKLQPGDILVYRKKGNGSGHAMLYVGDGMFFHSSGADYTGAAESYESSGTYLYQSFDDTVGNPDHVRYLIKQHSYVIMRPLDSFKGEIPADTRARCDAMRGIMAEKLSSHTFGQSVYVGGEVSFTFHLENFATVDKTVKITDTVPQYTYYVSGDANVDGNTLTWDVTVPSMGEVDVTYTVQVVEEEDAIGQTIKSESTVSGLAVNCREILIAKTLSMQQQTDLLNAVNNLLDSGLTDMALINAAYREIGITTLDDTPAATVSAELIPAYNGEDRMLDENHAYYAMCVPRLYGGMSVVEKTPMDQYRTRLLKAEQLLPGDVIVGDEECFLYTGTSVFDLITLQEQDADILECFLGYYAYTVLRPSMAA